MSGKTSEWSSPAVIVSIAGLIVSLIFNIIQFVLTTNANQRANQETLRANKEQDRADELQKKKDEWIKGLNSELVTLDQKINADKETLRIDNIRTSLSKHTDSDEGYQEADRNSRELDELEERRAALKNQINSFLSSYR